MADTRASPSLDDPGPVVAYSDLIVEYRPTSPRRPVASVGRVARTIRRSSSGRLLTRSARISVVLEHGRRDPKQAQMGAIGISPHTDRPGERPGHRRRGQDRKAQRRRSRREVTEEAIARRQRQPARRRASHRASGSAAVPARGGLVTRRCSRELAGLLTIQSTSPMVAMSRASTTRG